MGADLAEWDHDEGALPHSGVGHDELGGIDTAVVVEEEVEVEGTGAVGDGAPAAVLVFDVE